MHNAPLLQFRNNNIIQDRCHRCFFKIKNTITPVKAKQVDNTNINTSVVIEGLNNKNERISVLVVPINEMTNNAYFVRPTSL